MTKEKTAHLEEKLKDELLYREDCIDKISRYKKAIKKNLIIIKKYL